jgi:hypothetical protein
VSICGPVNLCEFPLLFPGFVIWKVEQYMGVAKPDHPIYCLSSDPQQVSDLGDMRLLRSRPRLCGVSLLCSVQAFAFALCIIAAAAMGCVASTAALVSRSGHVLWAAVAGSLLTGVCALAGNCRRICKGAGYTIWPRGANHPLVRRWYHRHLPGRCANRRRCRHRHSPSRGPQGKPPAKTC